MNGNNYKVLALNEARLMYKVGVAISGISKLIQDNETRKAVMDGGEFLDGYTLSGMMLAIELLADQLIDRGDEVSELLETGGVK